MLNVRGAARRVGRTRRTIARWIEDGDLPVAVELRDDRGHIIARWIDEEQLLATYRDKLGADPTRPRRRDVDTPS
jgi:predicted site-specific integrase-resolvase